MIPLFCFQTNCSDSSMTASFLFFYWILSSWPLPMPSSLHLFFFKISVAPQTSLFFNHLCQSSHGSVALLHLWRRLWYLYWVASKVTLGADMSWQKGKQEHGGPCGKFLWASPSSDLYHFPSHFISSGPKNRTKKNMPYNTKSKSFLPCFYFPHSCFYCQSSWARVATLPAVYSLSSPLWSCSPLLSPSWKWWVASHSVSSYVIQLLCILPFPSLQPVRNLELDYFSSLLVGRRSCCLCLYSVVQPTYFFQSYFAKIIISFHCL